jgi:hypothetical protein
MLSNVTIVITAGGRPGYLKQALSGAIINLAECKTVVVNDDMFLHTNSWSNVWKQMPNDTFLTKKRNEGVKLVDTKYTLLAADDFNFDIEARITVVAMMTVLDRHESADIVAGTVNGRHYAGYLSELPGAYIKETRVIAAALPTLHAVDIAANFFLARTEVLREVPWDENIGPIGGEHADWFLDLKAANKNVLWSPQLNINEQPKDRTKEAPDYRERRARAPIGHELFLKKRGIKRYYGFDEEVQEIK